MSIAEGRAKSSTYTAWSLPGVECTDWAWGVSIGANYTRYCPILTPTTIALDRIGISVANAYPAGAVRLGIFEADTDWQPGTLVVDAGTVSIATTGTKEIVINVTLQPGRYLIASRCNFNNIPGQQPFHALVGGTNYAGYDPANPRDPTSWLYTATGGFGTAWDTIEGIYNGGVDYPALVRVSSA